MSRLSRGLAAVATRAGLGRGWTERIESDGRRQSGWRAPLDDRLLRRLERATLTARRSAAGGLGGEHRGRARARSTEFVDHRPYLPGDDFRQIDWNAYGRLNQLIVKQTEARERLPLLLLLDCSASMNHGEPNKHDFARQLAAALGYVALARYDRVELVRLGGGSSGAPFQGKRRFAELLAALDRLEVGGSLQLDLELARLQPLDRAGQAILISDMLHPDGYDDGLAALSAAGYRPSVIHVLSRRELEPEQGGDFELVDIESGEALQIGLSPRTVAAYRERLAAWCQSVERLCAQRGIRYLRLTTDQALEEVTLVDLRRAGVLS